MVGGIVALDEPPKSLYEFDYQTGPRPQRNRFKYVWIEFAGGFSLYVELTFENCLSMCKMWKSGEVGICGEKEE